MSDDDGELLAEQIRYYDARAPVYEDLYLLRGSHTTDDPGFAAAWRRETARLEGFVAGLDHVPNGLELACGNGLWTRFLVERTDRLLAVDASPRMLARNREWVSDDRVRYVRADLFELELGVRSELVFAGFFLSHVPPSRWAALLGKVRSWMADGGVFAFVDDVWGPGRPRSGDRVPGGPDHVHLRRLGDEEFTIVKRFFRPDELVDALAGAGLDARVEATGEFFQYGLARAASDGRTSG